MAVRFAIFGLTLSSSWANGHATPWRGLLRALHRLGHSAVFFERDVEYYAQHRDLSAPDFCDLVLYEDWASVVEQARKSLRDADVAIVTSYCPDGLAACRLTLDTPGLVHAFYDLDPPVTLAALEEHGLAIPAGAHYLTPALIPEFDVYFSFTAGPLLDTLKSRWGARYTAPLCGSVDPELYRRVADPPDEFRCTLGYLGTYAADRQPALDQLMIEPARHRPENRFLVVGSLYPTDLEWPANVERQWHLAPPRHAAFYSANRLTLNVTRQAMREWGYTPSGRLFEAAACGTPILSDAWAGLDAFFAPDTEILVAKTQADALAALDADDAELACIGEAARARTLEQHTAEARARQLLTACEAVAQC